MPEFLETEDNTMNQYTPTDHPYLYLGSLAEAKRSQELGLWRSSHQNNIACKKAIEDAIRSGFDGMHLNPACVQRIIQAHGYKRTRWVLAHTLREKNYDGRFSRSNSKWAAACYIPACDRNIDFIVESHPAVLDGFVTLFRRALDDLHLFDQTHCIPLTGQELEGKVLVLSLTALKESCWSPQISSGWPGAGLAAIPTPPAGRSMPPVWATENTPAGTGATSWAFSRTSICRDGPRPVWSSCAKSQHWERKVHDHVSTRRTA